MIYNAKINLILPKESTTYTKYTVLMSDILMTSYKYAIDKKIDWKRYTPFCIITCSNLTMVKSELARINKEKTNYNSKPAQLYFYFSFFGKLLEFCRPFWPVKAVTGSTQVASNKASLLCKTSIRLKAIIIYL